MDIKIWHGVRCELTGFGDSAEVQEQTLNEFDGPDVDFVQLFATRFQ